MKTLVIITAAYPYGYGEDWMYKELKESSFRYDQIVIYPLLRYGEKIRWVPPNCAVSDLLVESELNSRLKFRDLFLIISVLMTEICRSGKVAFLLRRLLKYASNLKKTIKWSKILKTDLIKRDITDAHFYSVWLNEGAIIMAILKKRSVIHNFVMRLHGYDLFDERREGGYMPFRVFTFKWADKIFVLSQVGVNYIKRKNIYQEKVILNYSGLYDNGAGPFDPSAIFTIVSCSTMQPFKRVSMIPEILKKIDFPVRWIHIGDGPEFEDVKKKASFLPAIIQVELKGRLDNNEVINFYKTNHVNLFLHLSETEGLGMAAVEAQSFGIPVMATNVGGVAEVVDKSTGVLLSEFEAPSSIADKIIEFRLSDKNSKEYRKGVKGHFLNKFEAKKNYAYFFKRIMQ